MTMGKAARSRVVELFSIEKLRSELTHAHSEILAKKDDAQE